MSCRRLLGRGRGEDSVGMAGTVLQGAPLHNTQSWVSLAMSQPLNTPLPPSAITTCLVPSGNRHRGSSSPPAPWQGTPLLTCTHSEPNWP